MARPSKFSPERGRVIVGAVASGADRKAAAEAAGVGLRTLAEWLARGRASDPATDDLAEWVELFEAAKRVARRRRARVRHERERAEAVERWQRFKAARERWWKDQLGECEFWRLRLVWLADRGKSRAFDATVARLRAEGFGIVDTP
jgi:hypothetical protein